MGTKNAYDELGDYASRLVKWKAAQLVGRAGFTESDRADIEQDIAFQVLRRIRKFDPARGRFEATVRRIVENAVADILAARKAACRDYRRRGPSLNETVRDENGKRVERSETFESGGHLRRTRRPASERRDLKLDLDDVIAELPPDLRRLCERLRNESPTEIARDMGIPRGTLYERMRKIREHFERRGLGEYL